MCFKNIETLRRYSMRYCDFINQTISRENGIDWNYYRNDIATTDIFCSEVSSKFIKQYFENGEKALPLLLNPETADRFITNYFTAGRKESVLSYRFEEQYQLPAERAIHTVSGFFLGLLIENCINSFTPLSLISANHFPFAYLWFLTYLYHDYGYSVTEKEDCPIQYPQRAPIPCQSYTHYKYCHPGEYQALKEIKRELGINLSPFSQLGAFTFFLSGRNNTPDLEHALLTELTQRNNTVSGYPKLRFSNGSKIAEHQYPSRIITRYMNYCINERKRVDHGIVGGLLFYDRMIKNYMLAYISSLNEENVAKNLSDFYYRNRHFCSEQLTIFSYISDCILSHNIFKQSAETRDLYEKYKLFDLLEENFKKISYESNPLLYILGVADTIEPIKVYQKHNKSLSAQVIANAINIEYIPGTRSLSFSSVSKIIDISLLYQKAKGLMDWTSAECSELTNGSFTLRI